MGYTYVGLRGPLVGPYEWGTELLAALNFGSGLVNRVLANEDKRADVVCLRFLRSLRRSAA